MQGINVVLFAFLACYAYAVPAVTSSARPPAASADGPLLNGVFSHSCPSWDGFYGSDYAVMQATCNNGHGGTNTTTINLNDCIGNAGPNLVCAQKWVLCKPKSSVKTELNRCIYSGYFLAACTITSGPSIGSTILTASCIGDNNEMIEDSLDVSKCCMTLTLPIDVLIIDSVRHLRGK